MGQIRNLIFAIVYLTAHPRAACHCSQRTLPGSQVCLDISKDVVFNILI